MRRAITIRNQERGIALIFTLGILALLMIMMMAFASSMLQKRRISEATSSRLQTNLLVDSAINNATLQMMLTMNNSVAGSGNKTTGYNFNNVVSGSNDYSPSDLDYYTKGLAEDGDRPGALYTVIPSSDGGDNYVLYKFNNSSSAVFDYPTWVYVQDEFSSASSKPYVGRYAYAVVPSYPSLDYTLAINEFEDANRIGTSLADIDLTYIDDEFANIDKTGYGAIYNYQQLLALMGEDFEPDYVNFIPYISFNTPSNLEAFRASNKYGNSKLYHRYDLSTLNGKFSNKSSDTRVDALVSSGDFEQVDFSSGSVSKTSADYLAFFEKFSSNDDDDHTFKDSSGVVDNNAWRNQIIANLIDYTLDEDYTVTSDVDPNNWAYDTAPTYTGNKKTPYLNEVGMQIMIEVYCEPNTADKPKMYVNKIKTELAGEIVDIYGEGFSSEESCRIWTEIDFDFVDFNHNEKTGVFETSIDFDDDTSTLGIASFGTDTNLRANSVSDSDNDLYDVCEMEYTSGATLVNFDVNLTATIHAAKLEYSSNKGIDFANVNQEFSSELSAPISVNEYGTTKTFVFAYVLQAKDPRQNLNYKDWEVVENNEVQSFDKYSDELIGNAWSEADHSFGDLNDSNSPGYDAPSGGYDDEGSDLTDISTAFIREGNIESLWELGFIHRGVAWQTLNLKNTTVKDLTSLSSDSYADGDAEILDMVCLGTVMKINLNDNYVYEDNGKDYVDAYGYDSSNLLWQALFLGSNDKPLYVNGSVMASEELDDGDNLTVAISGDDNSSAISHITSKLRADYFNNLVTDDGQIYRRSALANALYGRDDLPSTDAGQEALIGKIANIVEAGQFPQVIRLIVVAQTLRADAVGTASPPQVSANAIATSVKKLVTIHRDASTNKFVIVNIEDID